MAIESVAARTTRQRWMRVAPGMRRRMTHRGMVHTMGCCSVMIAMYRLRHRPRCHCPVRYQDDTQDHVEKGAGHGAAKTARTGRKLQRR